MTLGGGEYVVAPYAGTHKHITVRRVLGHKSKNTPNPDDKLPHVITVLGLMENRIDGTKFEETWFTL